MNSTFQSFVSKQKNINLKRVRQSPHLAANIRACHVRNGTLAALLGSRQ